MGLVLITVQYGKEESAKLEILDCLFPQDKNAEFVDHGYGGLLLLDTALDPDEAAATILECPTSSVFKIIPVDLIVNSDIATIVSEAVRLTVAGRQRVAVVCKRRGRTIASSNEVEVAVGRELKSRGHTIDLKSPELIIRIDIIGEHTTISVRPPSGFFTKLRGDKGDQT
jgi:tRNA(Ser,Leu) C12 N-acetylase TAN1